MVSFMDFSFHGVYPNEDWDFASFHFEMTKERGKFKVTPPYMKA